MALSDAQRNAQRKKQGLKPVTKNSSSKKNQQKNSGTTQALTQTNSGKTADEYRRLREENITNITARQPTRRTEMTTAPKPSRQRTQEDIEYQVSAPIVQRGRQVNGQTYSEKREMVDRNATALRRINSARTDEDDKLMQLARQQAQELYNRTSDDRYRNDIARQNINDLQTEYGNTLQQLHDRYGYDTRDMQNQLRDIRQVNQTKNNLSANARSIVEQSGIQTRGQGDQDAYDTVIRYFGYDSKYRDADHDTKVIALDDLMKQYTAAHDRGQDTYNLREEIEWLANYQTDDSIVSGRARQFLNEQNKIRLEELQNERDGLNRQQGGEVDTMVAAELNRGDIFNREMQATYGSGFENQTFTNGTYDEQRKAIDREEDRLQREINQYERTYGAIDQYAPLQDNEDFYQNIYRGGRNNATREEMEAYDRQQGGEQFIGSDLVTEEANGYTPQSQTAPVVEDKLGLFLNTPKRELEQAYGAGASGVGNTWGTYMAEGVDGSWDQLTNNEVDTYYYLLNTAGQDTAYKYLDDMKIELNRRTQQSQIEAISQHMDDASTLEKIALSAASVPVNLLGNFTSGVSFVAGALRENVGGQEGAYNPYAQVGGPSTYAQAIRSAQASELDDWIGKTVVDEETGEQTRQARRLLGMSAGDVYQSIMSSGDSMAGSLLERAGFQGLYGMLMGMGAAASEAQELWEDGATDDQVVWGALLTGAAEGVFEQLSMDKIIDLSKGSKSIKDVVINALKSAFVEGSEEFNTEIADTIIDVLNRSNNSELLRAVDDYREQGYSDAQAQAKALVDKGKDVWKAFAGGAISGLLMGAGNNAMEYAAQQQQNIVEGRQILSEGGQNALYQLATEQAQQGNIFTRGVAGLGERVNVAAAQRQQARAENGGRLAQTEAARRVGQLSQQVEDTRAAQDRSDMAKYLRSRGKSAVQARAIASTLYEAMNAEAGSMSDEDIERLQNRLERYNKDGSVDELIQMLGDSESGINAREMYHEMARLGYRVNAEGELESFTGERGQEMTREAPDVDPSVLGTPTNAVKGVNQKLQDNTVTVNDEGVTTNTQTGQEIDTAQMRFKEIDPQTKTAVFQIGDETVNASDISFASDNEAILYSLPVEMGMSADSANMIVKLFRNVENMEAIMPAIDEAYRNGYYNQQGGIFSGLMNAADYRLVSKLGQLARNRVLKAERAQRVKRAASRVSTEGRSNLRRKGKLTYDSSVSEEMVQMLQSDSTEGLTQKQIRQRESVRVIEGLAAALGVDFHIVESVNGKWTGPNGVEYTANGMYKSGSGEIWIDLNAGADYSGLMIDTTAHELTHFIRDMSPDAFRTLSDATVAALSRAGFNVEVSARARMAQDSNLSYDDAMEEVVADAMSGMLRDGQVAELMSQIQQRDATLAEKVRDFFKKLVDRFERMIAAYTGVKLEREEAQLLSKLTDAHRQLQEIYAQALVTASNEMFTIGERNMEDFSGAVNEDGEQLFQWRAMDADKDIYRQMLADYGKMSASEIDELFNTVDAAIDLISQHEQELDFAWERDIDDRAFSAVKPNSDKLYQVSVDFSTLCRKRILQQVVQMQLQESLDRSLTKNEGIAIRDALMRVQAEGRQIEVACALCYVESARMKSYDQIKRFLDNRATVIHDFFAGRDAQTKDAMQAYENAERAQIAKENPNGVKGKGDAGDVDILTATLNTLPKKIADRLRAAKKRAVADYKLTAQEQSIIDAAMDMTVSDFTTPQGLENLAKNHRDLFDAYTSFIRNATKSKGIENDTWWRAGDSQSISDTLIANMNRENGFRSQSWSDFQVIHLLDYIAETIEMSTRGAKEQVYTKVPDFVDLMGLTGAMINMSLIPSADKYDGKLLYDSTEGFGYQRALKLRDMYPDTAGTICIGVEDDQIRALLADKTIDYVIPYHASGMSKAVRKLMHIPAWESYQDYQSEKNYKTRTEARAFAEERGVELLSEKDEKWHKAPGFSEWFDVDEARQIAEMENAANKEAFKADPMYGAYIAMQRMADRYLDLCAERGLRPKFSTGTDFTGEENYWKLLIDRKMINNVTGEIIEQRAIQPKFELSTVQRILNEELDRWGRVNEDQTVAVREVVGKLLPVLSQNTGGKMTTNQILKNAGYKQQSRDLVQSIADDMQTPVDNIVTTNVLSSVDQQAAEDYANAEVDSRIVDLVLRVRNGDLTGRVDLGPVPQEVIDHVQKMLGYDIRGYRLVIEGRMMGHMEDDHGPNGDTDHSMRNADDYGKLMFTLLAPDDMELSNIRQRAYSEQVYGFTRKAKSIVLGRNIGTNNYYVVETVPRAERKEVYISSMYIGVKGENGSIEKIRRQRREREEKRARKLNKKEGDLSLMDSSPSVTSEIDATPSNNIVESIDTTSQEENVKLQSRTVDTSGKTLTENQQQYFADSKVRDEQGRLKVMYHGSHRAGFTVFDPEYSDDQRSLFFTDKQVVARTYSDSELQWNPDEQVTFSDLSDLAAPFDMFPVELDDGRYALVDLDGDVVESFNTLKGMQAYIVDTASSTPGTDFPANYQVYLNITNPLIVDAKGGMWSAIDYEYDFTADARVVDAREYRGRYVVLYSFTNPATGEEQQWNSFGQTKDDIQRDLGVPFDDLQRMVGTEETFQFSSHEKASGNTRQISAEAKRLGYDGVIINNVRDNGWAQGNYEDPGASNIVIAFNSNQVKSIFNENPTQNEDIRYQERFVGETNQELLENADANAAQTPDERKALLSYQNYIEKQHSVRDRLNALNERIASGEGDTSEMQKTARDLEKQIRKYGTKLHELETSTPLRGLIERERVNAAERARERGQRALERYRENMTKKIEDIKAHNREQRAKGVDSRRRTELRGQIRRRVNDIEHILNHGTKDRNVKEGMRPAMEKAVNTARLLFSDLNNRDIARRNVAVLQTDTERSLYEEYRKYVDALDVYKARPNADSDPQLQRMIRAAESRISNLGEKLSEVFDRTRKSIYETAVDTALVELSDGYKDLANAPEAYIRNAYDENVVKKIEELRTNLEGATLMRMTQEQLEAMKDVYTMVATTIRNANELFADNLRATVTENGTQVMEEIRETNRNKKLRGVESRMGRSVRTYMWNNLKPIYAMERIGSKSLTALFKNIRRAEGVWAVDVNEAKDFLLDTEQKHNFNSWDLNQKKTFTADTGETFQMTLAQAMSIYAYTRRGDSAVNHLINGGFTFDNNAEQNTQKIGPFKRTGYVTDKQAYRIGLDTIEDITNMLTDEQKAWVDEMQDYLSDTMGEKGNEVSMAMYGVRLYNEEHYFPIRTDSTYRDVNASETAGEVKIKNAGFSNSLTPNASNPIILSDFLDIWSDHVNDMSMYHAFVLPLEDFQKVYNYRTSNANESGAQSVRSTLDTYYNGQASTYITQMLRDLNNGTRSDPRESAYKRLLSNFKKAATFVSASVVVQQPTSLFRAMAYIDPKYFVGTDTQLLRNGRLWEELKKYAPVAIIKEMGHFDTDMGVSTQEWMQSQDPKLFSRDGLKALLTDTNYRDSMLGKAPEMADQITWVAMWQACKREARDQNKNLTEEQILQKAGERFEDIVMYTQVYDSVLSRSSNMRSKSMFMSMATSFMAEPTTWANMVEHSIREMTRGNAKAGIRELGAVAVSSIAVAMMSSLVYAMRDDDDDETYTEKFMASFLGELLDELNPLTHLPIVQDVWNIMSGWSVERADMTLVENLYKSVDKLVEAWATDTKDMSDEELQEHSKKLSDAYWSMASTISAFIGVPMQNVRKDVMGLIHTIENAGSGMTPTKQSVLDAMGAEFRKSIPFLARFMPEKKRQQKLYDAIMSGDDEYAQRLGGQYANEIAFHTALRKALRENDDRIEAGARARYEGNIAEYIRIVNEIKAEGNFSQDDIVASMNTLINQWTNEAKESDGNGAPAAVSMFKNSDLFDALFSGDETSADVISEYLVEMKVADGKTEEAAVKDLNSAIVKEIRSRFKSGELTSDEFKDWMLQYSTKSEKDIVKETAAIEYEQETGFNWDDHENAYLSGQVTASDTAKWLMRIKGLSKADAETEIKRIDFRAADPDTQLLDWQINKYYSSIEKSGITIPVWTTYCLEAAKCKGTDKNGDGKTDNGSVKAQKMQVINSLPISDAQKDVLYLIDYKESTISDAPWR